MKCPMCNAEVPEGAAYCQDCGAKLPAFEPGTKEVTDTAPGGSARFDSTGGGARRDTPEETLWEGSYSPKAMLGTLVLCGVSSIALLVAAFLLSTTVVLSAVLVGGALLVWVAAGLLFAKNRLGRSYRLTNQMFYHREGVLTRTTDRVELIEIHDVKWEQGLFERLMNVGTITILSADKSHGRLPLYGIEDVESVANKIDKARRSEQLRRGRRIDFSNIDGQT